jgi:hypothetical protein
MAQDFRKDESKPFKTYNVHLPNLPAILGWKRGAILFDPSPNHQHPGISHICSPDFQFFKHL